MVPDGEWYANYAFVRGNGKAVYSKIFINADNPVNIPGEYRRIPGAMPKRRLDVVGRVNPVTSEDLARRAAGRRYVVQISSV